MGNQESQLFSVPAQKLDNFIRDYVMPNEECQERIDCIVDVICDILQSTEHFPAVQGVAKGGSYGRKTVLRGSSDGTLVLFLSRFKQFEDQRKNQQEILERIGDLLEYHVHKKGLDDWVEVQCGRVVIQVSGGTQRISFKVLPAFNALGFLEDPNPWIYRDLKRSLDKAQAGPGEFAVCFTELQEKFFNNRPRQLKNLILLVKYWHQQCQKTMEHWPVLSPYALELLTVYAWEQGCGKENFDIAEGVRTVLKLIKCQEQLCIYWTINYNFDDETVGNILLNQLQLERPVIVDPTDPTNDVSRGKSCWQALKRNAQVWLTSPSLDSQLPASSWNVPPAPLFATPGHLLDKFIRDFLQPDQCFLDQIETALDIICKFLTERCFQRTPAKIQIVRGGSTAKGTALKTGSDATLVVFHDSIKSYASQGSEGSKIVKEIQKQLEACEQEKEFEVTFEISVRKAPRALSFSLKSKVLNESIDFDVLPAFNALGQSSSGSTPSPKVYAELIQMYKSPDIPGGEFSTSFTVLQRNFIGSQPTKLRNLIRLVKHWYTQCERKLKPKGSLPPKYALELLTVHAWEHGSKTLDFDTAAGFRTVLELVTQYRQLCIFWIVNYNFEDKRVEKFLLTQIQKTRPVILDPAEPTGDVGGGDRWCWHLLAKEAKEWSSSLCFKDETGNPVQPWKVPTAQTPGSWGAGVHAAVSERL
ncbi:PREDICTED: 2'-5'-oligoadenylate synthase 2 [Propithecus coquereli]|uniref:2'-5'-oligoadenylate synthase 2 n=1 Tax=Propithecus coquereli TaxID=379532 RepID=UPI00063F4ADD|nr:PREDICTED: 2'-5'-oligoadenylate synthase 2 [Propithecus coquereli]